MKAPISEAEKILHNKWPKTHSSIMKGLSLVGKVKSHSEGRRRSVEVGTRLGAGVEAEGVVAELVSKLSSLVDRRHSQRG